MQALAGHQHSPFSRPDAHFQVITFKARSSLCCSLRPPCLHSTVVLCDPWHGWLYPTWALRTLSLCCETIRIPNGCSISLHHICLHLTEPWTKGLEPGGGEHPPFFLHPKAAQLPSHLTPPPPPCFIFVKSLGNHIKIEKHMS